MADAPPPDDPHAPAPASATPANEADTPAPAAGAEAGPKASAPTPAAAAEEGPKASALAPAAGAEAGPKAAAPAKPTAPAAKPGPKPAAEHPPKVAAPTGPSEPPPPADLPLPAFVTALQTRLPDAVSQVSHFVGDWTIIVPLPRLHDVLRYLRTAPDAAFDFCSDVTATDWPPRAERFDLVYCLYSIAHRHRIRVKARVAEHQPVPSVTDIWTAANWLEREVFDMFGVNFTGHPDRRRILMPDDWQGYPQRKDYPLEGPGELLMENPIDWLKLRQTRDEADIE